MVNISKTPKKKQDNKTEYENLIRTFFETQAKLEVSVNVYSDHALKRTFQSACPDAHVRRIGAKLPLTCPAAGAITTPEPYRTVPYMQSTIRPET
ncbi:hypothetical protein ROS1_10440 [Roseibium sp. ROS1]